MESRRDFIKKAALLSGAFGLAGTLPPSVQRALAINPDPGTTWRDADHVVILMQENRSFDHCYGSLQGVRGFNDPRAITLPDQNPVWLQTNKAGETYAPFRLNIKDTRATWMGSLPHSWTDQVDARNDGKMDRWLDVKQSGHPPFAKMPLTLGYYTREDLPFYYSLADAFTVCDQNFCSSLTGTTPNRLYLWTGTIREAANEHVHARVMNEDADYTTEVGWTTFPERLEDHGISWKIYQNELSVGVGLFGEEDAWLTNFGDNPIEYFKQFNVRFLPAYIKALPANIAKGKEMISGLQSSMAKATPEEAAKQKRSIKWLEDAVAKWTTDEKLYTTEKYNALSPREKSLHAKAFVTNTGDPNYHELETLKYTDGGEAREIKIPKGDVFHQFREDVNTGKLPAVSWLVAPENLSDHPTSPWYGAAYVSEAMDILTQNPEVWKKTIFILCYDENDGYFDHAVPFAAPYPGKPETGLTSKKAPDGSMGQMDTSIDFVKLEQDRKWKPAAEARESSIGLGFRVPLVIASPWSRGGVVNSQVFDHTSVIQFLEKLLSHKTKKKVEEPNISEWRRAVCGDLTSVFKPWTGEPVALPAYLKKNEFFESVHQAKFKKEPGNFQPLSSSEIASTRKSPANSGVLPRQEKGTRPACAIPYEITVNGNVDKTESQFALRFAVGENIFASRSAGAPLTVYAYNFGGEKVVTRSYAANPATFIDDVWPLAKFEREQYHLKAYGPNGFYREFHGSKNDPGFTIRESYQKKGDRYTGNLTLTISNLTKNTLTIQLNDRYNNARPTVIELAGLKKTEYTAELKVTHNWYDISVTSKGDPEFIQRFAGKAENGEDGFTDPAMA